MNKDTMMDLLRPYQEKKRALSRMNYSKQHAKGRLSAIERVELLFDPGTFVEIGALAQQDQLTRSIKPGPTPRDGIVTGYGRVNGRIVFAGAYDITVKGGSMGFVGEWKLTRVKRLAMEQGCPLVLMCDGTGARLEEEISSKAGYDNPQFANLCALSGYVPIVVAVMGESFGGHANLTALGDFVPMTKGSTMALVGPPLLKSKLNVEITKEKLGGVEVHCDKSGMADMAVEDDRECIENKGGMNRMIRTDLCNLLGCKYPIVQAAMGPFDTTHLAYAVSNAGGMGVISHPSWDMDFLRSGFSMTGKDLEGQIAKLKDRAKSSLRIVDDNTDNTFGLNLRVAPEQVDVPQLLDTILEEREKSPSMKRKFRLFISSACRASPLFITLTSISML